jgi:hypothetical protein
MNVKTSRDSSISPAIVDLLLKYVQVQSIQWHILRFQMIDVGAHRSDRRFDNRYILHRKSTSFRQYHWKDLLSIAGLVFENLGNNYIQCPVVIHLQTLTLLARAGGPGDS